MDRRGLGRGLSALIPGGEDGGAVTVVQVEIDSIALNPWQPRKHLDDESIAELSASVREHGIIQPIVVRTVAPGRYQLVAGERRLRAARAAGLTTVPALLREMPDQESLEVAMVENLQREDISPLDAAGAYQRLMEEFDLSQEEIAARVGKSRPAVANTLRLLQLPKAVLARLEKGELTEGHARALLMLSNPNAQILLADDVIRRQCSVRETERLARTWPAGTSAASTVSRETVRTSDANLAAVEEQLRQLFKTKVRVSIAQDRGRIEIEFYGEDDLNRILGLIGAICPPLPGAPRQS